MRRKFIAYSEQETLNFAAELAKACHPPCLIFLSGKLGAGKTAFTRGFLRGLGYQGKVKSPSYTIIEPYQINGTQIYHIDLYRLNGPQEVEFLGLREYLQQEAICLIEWPEKGAGYLLEPNITVDIQIIGKGRMFNIEKHPLKS